MLFRSQRVVTASIEDAVLSAVKQLKGAFSMVLSSPSKDVYKRQAFSMIVPFLLTLLVFVLINMGLRHGLQVDLSLIHIFILPLSEHPASTPTNSKTDRNSAAHFFILPNSCMRFISIGFVLP